MSEDKPKSILQPVDDATRRQARGLIRSARFAALGTIDIESSGPSVSRVVLATFPSGEPGFFISALASHHKNLTGDPRCSLLIGEPGKGDPLAHPRMTLIGRAHCLHSGPERENFRTRYRNRNPKSSLYEDLPDFSYWKFEVSNASLNAGFGKAYRLDPSDIVELVPDIADWRRVEPGVIEHMNGDHASAVDRYAALAGGDGSGWRMVCIDPEGIDLVRSDEVRRLWFDLPLRSTADIRPRLVALASS